MNAAERTEVRRAWSEAAGLIAAAARGEPGPHDLLKQLAVTGDLTGALTLLHCALVTAGDALRLEVERATARGEDGPPSLAYVLAVQRHAAAVESGEVELP